MITPKILSDKYVDKLYTLFTSQSWILDNDEEIPLFDRFCERMAELDNDSDRDFMLELTQSYLWVQLEQYENLLNKAFTRIVQDNVITKKGTQYLCICPLLPEKDFDKIKSSTMMLYLCQDVLLRHLSIFHNRQIRICSTPKVLKDITNSANTLEKVILIDDFIGSGETAIGCIDYIKSIGIEQDKLLIISLVAQYEGIQLIKEQNIPIYVSIIRKRGISDTYPPEIVKLKLEQMKKIGKKIKAPKDLMLGYGETEALVSMVKTPNNTFPFYWYEKNENSYAPFPRRSNIKII